MDAPQTDTGRMVADVGGTNTRIALFDQDSGTFRATRSFVNRDYANFEDVIANWMEELDEAAPLSCCIAVAAPPSKDQVTMSNIDWSFSCRELARRFGFQKLGRINDFESNAYSLPYLSSDDLTLLYPGKAGQAGMLATVGPGTGLGGAFLSKNPDGSHSSHACEPGHMGLTPATALELELFRLLLPQHSNIYAELLVSGPGLLRLYSALAEIQGTPADNSLEPVDISRRAVNEGDELCALTLNTFCALLGSVCGDFMLANGSYGGLYLAGGIVPGIIPWLRDSTFCQRLQDKGAMRQQLANIPVYMITASHPGLIGAAHAPL